MKIKRLDLVSFGKFDNKSLELDDGINIVYGENEAGKTTIHNFIDGMFYGFLKANVRNAIYLDEHRLYEPWDRSRYAGIITIKQGDEKYRIEREFTKGKEKTTVFLESTGEDVTDRIDTGQKNRILQPGYHFFGFNSSVFRNTISIKQLETKTEEDLSKEIKEKLVNATHALDDEISVKKAIKSLENDLKEIGSTRAPTSRYARTKKKIEKLKEEIATIKAEQHEYESLLGEVEKLEKDHLSSQEDLRKRKEVLTNIKLMELQEIYNKGTEVKDEIEELEESIENLKEYKDLSEDDFKEIREKNNHINIIENNLQHKEASKEKLENKINDLKDKIEDTGSPYYGENSVKYNRNLKNSIIVMGVLIAILILVSLIIDLSTMALLGGVLLLLVLGGISFYINSKNINEEIKYKKFKRNEFIEEVKNHENELQEIYEEIDALNENKKVTISSIKILLEKNQVIDLDDFEKKLDFKEKFIKNCSQIEDKKILYKRVMGDHSLESLNEKLENFQPMDGLDISMKESTIREKQHLENKSLNLQLEITRNKANLETIEKSLKHMAELEEELAKREKSISKMDDKVKAIELAKSTIEGLSKNIHQDFAPHINEKVSHIISRITKGKYDSVRVNDKLDLCIINPDSRELLKYDSLSGGTIDQLYFALRFGIISSISQEKLPLILDDCFTQYDDYRLRNVLELLRDLSKDRQLILFTCQKREKETLEELKIGYNLVEI